MGDKWTASFYIATVQTPPVDIRFALPHDATLVHVSACVDTDITAANKISVGTPTDTEAYLEASGIPSSANPSDLGFTDFVTYENRAYPRLSAGDILVIQLTRAAGNLDDHISVTLTFLDE